MKISCLSFFALCLLPANIMAQNTTGFSVGGAVLYAAVSGDDFQGTNAGLGFDLQGRYRWGGFSLGAGLQYTSHDVQDFSENLGIRGLFVEPRYTFSAASPSVAPYVMGRLSILKERIESGSDTYEANGTGIGVGGGVLVRLNPTTQVDISTSYATVSFGDAKLDGWTFPDTDTHGSSLILRIGIILRVGK